MPKKTTQKKRPAKKSIKKSAARKTAPKIFTATGCNLTGKPLSAQLVKSIQGLESELGKSVFMLIQTGSGVLQDSRGQSLDFTALETTYAALRHLPRGKEVVLLIHSPGGYAQCAFQMAKAIRNHCGSFDAIIPRYAKSAATLITLGANRIILGENAELGPLDVQLFDRDREDFGSALNEVQSLERLHAFSLEALDSTMFLLMARSGKPTDKVLPLALDFCCEMMRPLLEKIDSVHFTKMSRLLKEAEQYAVRLLQPKYSMEAARRIASNLVENYPDHSFVIDREEANELGLKVERTSGKVTSIVSELFGTLDRLNVVGCLQEVSQP